MEPCKIPAAAVKGVCAYAGDDGKSACGVECIYVPAAPERDPICVQRWPDCAEGEFDPRCCRFPKSCSCTVVHGETFTAPVPRLFHDGYFMTHDDVYTETQRLLDEGWTILAILGPSRNVSGFSIFATHPTRSVPTWEE